MSSPATDLRDPDAVIDLLDAAAASLLETPGRRGCTQRLPATGRLLATGDLHDNPIHLAGILKLAALDRGPDRHVVLHELIHGDRLINGMDFSHRMLARTAELVLAHPGQVHPMLANHEMSQMTGRAVTKGAGDSCAMFSQAVDYVYGDAADEVTDALHRFIRAMPLAVISASGLLCAHSLPSAIAMKGFDVDVFDRELTDEDFVAPAGAAYRMVWGRDYTDESVQTLADRWGVELFCLGHQHVETGIEIRAGRVIVLNSDHERATVLPLDLASLPTPEEAMMSAVPLAAVGAT